VDSPLDNPGFEGIRPPANSDLEDRWISTRANATRLVLDINLGSQDVRWNKTLETIIGGHTVNYSALIEQWIQQFIYKNKDYQDGADDLGAPGQYAEIHRKIRKLKKAMWDGEPLSGEPAREVLLDLIGHCFLAIKHMDENNYGGKPTK
jgi:hypothetical protein